MIEPIAEKVTIVHRRDKFRAHEHSVTLLGKSRGCCYVTKSNTLRIQSIFIKGKFFIKFNFEH